MLVFNTTDKVKRSRRRSAIWNIVAGTCAVLIVAMALLFGALHSERFPLVLCLLLLGLPRLYVGIRDYYRDFIRGGIHLRVIANTRTAAIKVGGKPAIFIKREDCVALGVIVLYVECWARRQPSWTFSLEREEPDAKSNESIDAS